MAKVKSKGTALQQEIASAYVAVAQIISLDKDEMASETYEADTLDNADADILHEPTGRSEPGSLSGELFFDPALAGHQRLTALVKYPVKENWKVVFADTGATEWPIVGAGFGLGFAVALNDGLKAPFSIKLAQLPTFPSITSTSAT